MSERWDDFLAGFDSADLRDGKQNEREERFVERLESDQFAWLDELVAERQRLSVAEVRRGYFPWTRRNQGVNMNRQVIVKIAVTVLIVWLLSALLVFVMF